MIINTTVMIEKFNENEEKGYDYLIDNAETDLQTEVLLGLQRVASKIPKEINESTYIQHRNIILEEIGVDPSPLKNTIMKGIK